MVKVHSCPLMTRLSLATKHSHTTKAQLGAPEAAVLQRLAALLSPHRRAGGSSASREKPREELRDPEVGGGGG